MTPHGMKHTRGLLMFDMELLRPQWFDFANCHDEPVETFFPERGDNLTLKRAKQICEECVVKQECYDYSMELSEKFETLGIWGGVSQKSRRAILQEQNKSHRRQPYPDYTT